MAISVRVRSPRVAVTIVRHARADGSSYIPITPSDLRGSIIDIVTNRRFGDAGTFQITLNLTEPDSKFLPPNLIARPTWADAIMPMDAVQIVVEVESPNGTMASEVIMRGFVSSVAVAASYRSGPQRAVVIGGNDFHKIMMARLYSLNDKGIIPGFQVLETIEEGLDLIQPNRAHPEPERDAAQAASLEGRVAYDLMKIFYTKFYSAIFNDLLNWYDTAVTGFGPLLPNMTFEAESLDELGPGLRVISPLTEVDTTQPFLEMSELFDRYSHQPWRELYFDDYMAGTVAASFMIWRPTPWLDRWGAWVQFQTLTADPLRDTFTYNDGKAWLIPPAEIIEDNRGWTDQQVANFIATYGGIYGIMTMASKTMGSKYESTSSPANPTVIGLDKPTVASSFRQYGWRLFEAHSAYFDINQVPKQDDRDKKVDAMRRFSAQWNSRLVAAGDHMELLSSGTVTIAGNPLIHMGHYVAIPPVRPSSLPAVAALSYVEGVSHSITFPTDLASPNGAYTTELILTRGREKLWNPSGSPAVTITEGLQPLPPLKGFK